MVTISEGSAVLEKIKLNIERGLNFHRQGYLDDAEAMYQKVLDLDPNHPDALHFLGVLIHTRGNSSASVELILKAISIKPNYPEAYCNLGVSLEALNRLHEAMAAYKEAITIKPHYMEACFNLGNLHLKLDDPDAAITNYQNALAIKPTNTEIHINLGNAWSAKGDHSKAAASYKFALNINPSSVEAHINLGNTLRDSGDFTNAIDSYRCALLLQPHLGGIHMKIGKIFSDKNDTKAAIKYFEKGIRLLPNDSEAHLILGVELAKLGNFKSAIDRIKQSIKINPELEVGYYEYFRLADVTASDPILNNARKLIKSAKISEAGKMYLNFALGGAELNLGNKKKGIDYLMKANAIRKEYSNYNIQKDHNLFTSIKQFFCESRVDNWNATKTTPKTRPIFILGMPYSGTTLVEQIVSSHSKVHGGGELAFLKDAVYQTGWASAANRDEVYNHIKETYLENLSMISNSSVITDKTTLNFRWIGFILEALPEAKILHLKRSAPAVCWSNFKTFFAADGLQFSFDLQDIANYYMLYENLMEFWHQKYPHKIYDINYEILTENPEAQIKKIFQYIELDWDPDVLNFHKNIRPITSASQLQARFEIYKGSSNEWRNYKAWLSPMLHILNRISIGQTIQK